MVSEDKVQKPKGLKSWRKTGTLAFCSPVKPESLQQALNFFKSKQIEVEVELDPSAAYGKYDFLFASDSPQARVAGMERLLAREDIQVIHNVRGAAGCLELLPLIDFKKVARSTKPLLGFSDFTALLVAAYQAERIVSFHGPNLLSFSEKTPQADKEQMLASLQALLAGGTGNLFESSAMRSLVGSGSVEGRLLGGNLSILTSLLGTPWEPNFDDHIFFFEDAWEAPHRLHRMLSQFKLSGKFRKIRGVLVGTLYSCEHHQGLGPSATEVIQNIFQDVGVPVFLAAPFGHIPCNIPIPLGIHSRLDDSGLTLLESAVDGPD